jgi:hypothetical protein
VRPGGLEIGQDLAAEAVLAHAGHGALHAGLISRPPDAGGIDHEAARLSVLEEGGIEERLQRIRPLDDRLRVIGNQDAEDAQEIGPGRLAGLDRRLGRLPEDRIDEAVAREHHGEDPRPKAPAPPGRIGGEVRHPAGVELDLLAGAAVGDRNRRGGVPEAELGDREAPEGRVADLDALAPEQLPDLGQPPAGLEVRLNDRALGGTLGPAVAMRATGARLNPLDDGGEHPFIESVGPPPRRKPPAHAAVT